MPEIILRKDALSSGIGKYFTGQPCRNGHIAYRYTQSGTCESCINSSSPSSPERHAERLEARQNRAELERVKLELRRDRLRLDQQKVALSQQRIAQRTAAKRTDLVPYRALLHYADVEYFKSVMFALAMEIEPSVALSDLLTNKAPETSGERAIHTFRTFQANHTNLRTLEHSLRDERQRSATDADTLHWRTTMAERDEQDAIALAAQDNGSPERLDA